MAHQPELVLMLTCNGAQWYKVNSIDAEFRVQLIDEITIFEGAVASLNVSSEISSPLRSIDEFTGKVVPRSKPISKTEASTVAFRSQINSVSSV